MYETSFLATAHGLPVPPASLPSTFPVKIPESYLVDINQLISKFVEKAKVQNNIEEEKSWRADSMLPIPCLEQSHRQEVEIKGGGRAMWLGAEMQE